MKYKFFHASGLLYVMNYCFYHINIEINDCWIKIDLEYNDKHKANEAADYKQAYIKFNIKEAFFNYNHEDNSLKKALTIYLKLLYNKFNNLVLIEGL